MEVTQVEKRKIDKEKKSSRRRLRQEFENVSAFSKGMPWENEEERKEDKERENIYDEYQQKRSTFDMGDYMKVIRKAYQGYYATVTDCSVHEEIEINNFQRKEKFWKLRDYDLDSRIPDEIKLVQLSQVVFYWGGDVCFK